LVVGLVEAFAPLPGQARTKTGVSVLFTDTGGLPGFEGRIKDQGLWPLGSLLSLSVVARAWLGASFIIGPRSFLFLLPALMYLERGGWRGGCLKPQRSGRMNGSGGDRQAQRQNKAEEANLRTDSLECG